MISLWRAPDAAPDTLEDRSRAAVARMKAAERELHYWRVKGWAPRVVWHPTIQIVSASGEVIDHTTGLLPELLWLFSLEGSTDWCGQRLPSQSFGGVA